MPNIIAIDGPAGAGKSTVARRIARELRYTYLDTGAMYRSVAWKARECGIDIEDAEALRTIAEQLDILFSPLDSDLKQTIRANGEDITQTIRTPEISTLTSRVAAVAPVRAVVVRKQRSIAATADRGVVLEGRDIGSVVFPNADLKLFLTAGPGERARRRVEELLARGLPADFDTTLDEIVERDKRDSERSESPLTKTDDAIEIDTDGLSIDEVTRRIISLWQERQV